jgi:hypothetical protein
MFLTNDEVLRNISKVCTARAAEEATRPDSAGGQNQRRHFLFKCTPPETEVIFLAELQNRFKDFYRN